jgi:hypothetical protein
MSVNKASAFFIELMFSQGERDDKQENECLAEKEAEQHNRTMEAKLALAR